MRPPPPARIAVDVGRRLREVGAQPPRELAEDARVLLLEGDREAEHLGGDRSRKFRRMDRWIVSSLAMARTLAVIGGGIAGLTHGLRADGSRCGGRLPGGGAAGGGNVRTDRVDGFTCEWGANGFLDNAPATPDLIRRLGIEDRLQPADAAAAAALPLPRRAAARRCRWAPGSFLALRRADLGREAAPGRGGACSRGAATAADESVLDFASRRIGARRRRRCWWTPWSAGSTPATRAGCRSPRPSPRWRRWSATHGSLTRALLAKRKAATAVAGRARGRLTSFKGGMQDLIDGLAKALGPRLRTGAAVRDVTRSDGRYTLRLADGTSLQADRVALTVPAWSAAPMVEGLDAELAEVLAEIPAAPVVVCHLGFEQADLAGHAARLRLPDPAERRAAPAGRALGLDDLSRAARPQGRRSTPACWAAPATRESIDWPDERVRPTVLDELHTTMHLRRRAGLHADLPAPPRHPPVHAGAPGAPGPRGRGAGAPPRPSPGRKLLPRGLRQRLHPPRGDDGGEDA